MKSTVSGAVALGITPSLTLGKISLASAAAGVVAAAPWAVSEFFSAMEKRNRAEQHGMYYLMNFKR